MSKLREFVRSYAAYMSGNKSHKNENTSALIPLGNLSDACKALNVDNICLPPYTHQLQCELEVSQKLQLQGSVALDYNLSPCKVADIERIYGPLTHQCIDYLRQEGCTANCLLRDRPLSFWCQECRNAYATYHKKQVRVQSNDTIELSTEESEHLDTSLFGVASNNMMLAPDSEYFVIVERVAYVGYWLRKCESAMDYMVCTGLAYHMLTGESITKNIWNAFYTIDPVQDDTCTRGIKFLRNCLDMKDAIVNDPLIQKTKSLYTYMLVQGCLKPMGLELSTEEFKSLERRSQVDYTSRTNLLVMIAETAVHFLERLDNWRLTGNWHAMLHDGKVYTQWIEDADRIIRLAPFTSNLKDHGTDHFTFLADLKDCIERGDNICKFAKTMVGVETHFVKKKLNALKMIDGLETSKRSAQNERAAPFGVLLHGCSSVGKSNFTLALFHYFAKINGLNNGEEYRYVRNPAEEYWNNFNSSKWFIHMDDVAFVDPKKCPEVDGTLKEIISVVNNVPYVPPQAAIEDKGRTPVRAKLVVATTNVAHLNADEYFTCPLAVRRRLPYIVHVKPKKEYMDNNKVFLDPQKLPPIDSDTSAFPDFWDITVQKIVPMQFKGKESGRFETVAKFSKITDFLKHFGKAARDHEKRQASADLSKQAMAKVKVCRICLEIGDDCNCVQSWTGTIFAPIIAYFGMCYSWVLACIILHVLEYSTWSLVWCGLSSKWFARIFNWFASWSNYTLEIKMLGILAKYRKDPIRFKLGYIIVALKIVIPLVVAGYVGDKLIQAVKGGSSPPVKSIVKTETKSDSKNDNVKKVVEIAPGYYEDYTEDSGDEQVVEVQSLVPQGNVLGTTSKDLPRDETGNVWWNPTQEILKFDVPLASQSRGQMSDAEIRDLFSENCVKFNAKCGIRATNMRGVFVHGQWLLTKAHAFKQEGRYHITIVGQKVESGVTGNVDFWIDSKNIRFNRSKDLCALRILTMPPKKSILKFWSADLLSSVTRALEIKRENNGDVTYSVIRGCNTSLFFPVESLGLELPIMLGISEGGVTKDGDCGALVATSTRHGPVIVGVHQLGYNRSLGTQLVTRSEIEELIDTDTVTGGGAPQLSLQGEVTLQPIHHKSIFRYIRSGMARVYGSMPGFRSKPKSRVVAHPLRDEMVAYYDTEVEFGAPEMRGWEPWRKNVVEMVKPEHNIDENVLKRVTQSFARDIIEDLTNKHGEAWKGELIELTDDEAVNGIPGVKFIDGLNRGSSMGHPWNESKRKHLKPDPTSQSPDGVTFDDAFWERVRGIEKKYRSRIRCMPIFKAHLKDEPTKKAKIAAKKTRMFTGAPADWSIVVRKYMLPFVRLLQNNKFTFEAAPGTNPMSDQWTEIYEYLTQHGKDRIIAGDYGKFDKRMVTLFIAAAFEVIKMVYQAAGCEVEIEAIIDCIATDTMFPIVDVHGDIVEFFGTNPSGHPLTVIINSLVNSLYVRYAYAHVNPDGKHADDFKQNVSLMTYGDDNIMGCRVDWFNHTVLQKELAKIGVEYTMADKESVSVPFISIDDCQFLKRSWRFEEELGLYTCPLEESSIIKSLTTTVLSDDMDKKVVDTISAANMEYFNYGKTVFEKHHRFFREILERTPYKPYVGLGTLPGWDELKLRFERASQGCKTEEKPSPGGGFGQLASSTERSQNSTTEMNMCCAERQSVRLEGESHQVSPNSIEPGLLRVQSEEIVVPNSDGNSGAAAPGSISHDTSETTTFVDSSLGVYTVPPLDVLPETAHTEDVGLGGYLARPVTIDERTWSTPTAMGSLGNDIDVWYEFLNHPSIKRKIDNFAFIRGKLHIKTMINATPFQYGYVRACYFPMANRTRSKTDTGDTEAMLVPLSQLPGYDVLPQSNSAGEMECPFFYNKHWLPLTSESSVREIGALRYVIYAPLDVAISGGPDSLTVRTVAWMSDVELMGPTNTLSLQGDDEYGNGPVSAPAAAVANVAGYLTKVPVIGVFAKATEIGASAVSKIASLFGFSNPPNIDNVAAYNAMSVPQLATAEISVPYQKLTLDPKAELSIDPSVANLSQEDELAISYLKKKRSLFMTTNWNTTDAPDTILCAGRATPQLRWIEGIENILQENKGARVFNTPLSHISEMFAEWRGSLKLTFRVIATQYHKGRLKFVYDPAGDCSGNPPITNVYSHIFDLSDDNTFSVTIPYLNKSPWARFKGRSSNRTVRANPPSYDADIGGNWAVYNYTTLEAPVAGSVRILVYIEGGDDLEFCNPRNSIGAYDNIPPSFYRLQGEEVMCGDVQPVDPHRYLNNYGDPVHSLRKLLRRSVHRETYRCRPSSTNNLSVTAYDLARVPMSPGFSDNGNSFVDKILGTGITRYQFGTMHPLTWVAMMFGGYRGGTHVSVASEGDVGNTHEVRVGRNLKVEYASPERVKSITLDASGSDQFKFFNTAPLIDGAAGLASHNIASGAGVQVVHPDMNRYLFGYTSATEFEKGNSDSGTDLQGLRILNVYENPTGNAGTVGVVNTVYTGAGADFTCFMFLCAPPVDYPNEFPVINDP